MNIWSRLGLSVAMAAAFCIVVTEILQHRVYYQAARLYACGVFAGCGLVMSFAGWIANRDKKGERKEEEGSETEGEGRSVCSSHLLFWGPVLVVFGCVVLAVPYKPKEETVAARAAVPAPGPSAPPPILATAALPVVSTVTNNVVVFPEIKIQGLVYRPPRNAVVVNGKSYFEGDMIEKARVFLITGEALVLEMDGQYKTVRIDSMLQPRGKS